MAAPANYQTISTLSAVLRQIILPMVREQLANRLLFFNVFQRTTKTVRRIGNNFAALMAIRTQHNQSIGNRGVAAALPPHGRAAYDTITVTLARTYGRGAIDGAILTSPLQGSASVVGGQLTSEMDSLMRTMEVDHARQIQGDGSGALCRITTTGATADTFTVDDPRYLEPGMRIDSFAAKTGGSANLDSEIIKDVDLTTGVVVMESAGTWVTNDYVFREDNRGLEISGLQAAVDDGAVVSSYQGQNRSTSSIFKGNLLDGAAGPMSINLLLQAYNLSRKVANIEPNFIGSDLDSQRYYAVLQQARTRFVNELRLASGHTGLEFAGGSKRIGWFADNFFPDGYTYFLHTPNFAFFEANQIEYMDKTGSVLHLIHDYDLYEFILTHYWQLGCDRSNCQTRLYNYGDPTA